jgi:uncharacterized membrane protein
MREFIARYLVSGAMFAVVDFIWLTFIANKFYRSQIGPLLLDKPNIPAAVLFYLIFLVGVVVFVVNPALASGGWKTALGLGALFGFVTYATYDLTNLAVLKNYTVTMAVVDMLWGTILTASVGTLAVLIIQKFFA